MAKLWTKLGAGALFSILIGLALVVASHTALLPEAPDQITYDWRTYLLTERAARPRDDIAIVLVDERSLSGYPYVSPIDRGMLAELVAAIDAAGPKAIGLDLIFDRATELAKDDALAATLRRTKAPVILGAVDRRGGEDADGLAYQEAFIARADRPAGHVFFGAEKNRLTLGDQAVRFMLPPSADAPSRQAFARVLAKIDGPKPAPASPLIYWRKPPVGGGTELFPTFTVPAHRDGAGVRTGPILPESWRGAFAGKIVLIGGAFGDRDRHLTPLAVATREQIHGVKIHAQILAQLRDGRSVHAMPGWAEFLVVAAMAGMGVFAAQRWRLKGDGWRTSLVATVAMVAAGLALFWAAHFILPSATLLLGWGAGLFAGDQMDAPGWRGRIFGGKTTSASEG